MRRCARYLTVCILVLTVVFSLSGLEAAAAEETVRTGTLGDNNGVQWSYNESTKTLTLTGSDSGLEQDDYYKKGYIYNICPDVEKIILKDFTPIGAVNKLFADLKSLKEIEMQKFDTSKVTNMTRMFDGCSSLTELDLSGFNTSNVTDMGSMFYGCSNLSKLVVNNFDTTKVKDLGSMFNGCSSLTELDLSSFNTSNTTNLSSMFKGCSSLKELDLSNFTTEKVTSMVYTFSDCNSLVYLNISNFDTSSVTEMYDMFAGCKSLTSLDVSKFNTSNVTSMNAMFWCCKSLTSLDVSGFDTSNVTNMYYLFCGCDNLEQLDLSKFKTEKVITMGYMFSGCSSLKKLNVSSFDTSNVIDMTQMFCGCESLTELDLSNFNTNKVRVMQYMFSYCTGLKKLNLKNLNTANLTSMDRMFEKCSSLTNLDLSSFNTSNVTNMSWMFYDCGSLVTLDLSGFDTGNVSNMYCMFEDCTSLESLNVSGFDTAKVQDMRFLFDDCNSLTNLNLSSFDLSGIKSDSAVSYIFSGCSKINTLYTPKNIPEGLEIELSGYYVDSDGNLVTSLTKESCSTLLTKSVAIEGPKKMKVGDSSQLQIKLGEFLQDISINSHFYWSTSASNVASVSSSGVLKAVGAGTVTITAVTRDGSMVAECQVTVEEKLGITTQPVSQKVAEGTEVTFLVAATGKDLTYQWQFKNTVSDWTNSTMAGTTTNSLTVKATAERNGYQYRCIIKDSDGNQEISNAAMLTITPPIEIVFQPICGEVMEGTKVDFGVFALGSNLTYQWQFKSPANDYWSVSTMAGANTYVLTVKATAARNGYQYRCVIKDNKGNKVISEAVKLTVIKAINITTQPASQNVTEGTNATFKVAATGTNLTYQWQFKNAINNYWSNSTMAGATTNSITVKGTAARNGYQYRCVIKDNNGNKVTSNAAKLTIAKPIEITTQPANQNVAVGANATFKVEAKGTNLTYQWQFKSPANAYWADSTMTGATTNSITVKGTTARNGYQYRCVIKDSNGNKVTSNAAQLTVK